MLPEDLPECQFGFGFAAEAQHAASLCVEQQGLGFRAVRSQKVQTALGPFYTTDKL